MENFIEFRKSVHSQFGEDGIIEQIFKTVDPGDKLCVELGAWDGIHLSNTRKLIEENTWKAVLIESDPKKFESLKNNCSGFNLATPILKTAQANNFNQILNDAGVPKDFSLLSLDVDGDEYLLWKSLVKFRPRVVLVESNYTFPFNVEFVQKRGLKIGNSALSLVLLGKQKGYRLVCYNVINCIFVREDMLPSCDWPRFVDLFHMGLTYQMGLHSCYEGKRYLSGEMPWGRAQIIESEKMSEFAEKFVVYMGSDYSKIKDV